MMILLMMFLLFILQQDMSSAEDGLARDETWGVKRLVEYHKRLRPAMEVRDVYKLLFQANFGAGHSTADTTGAKIFLHEELLQLDPSETDEPLLERISTENRYIRVNLRRFKPLNLDPEWLVQAMVHSAHTEPSDTLTFVRQWNEVAALVRYGLLDFSPTGLEEWDALVRAGDFRPVHHSRRYTETYRPAYRVVRLSLVDEHLALKR